MNKKMQCNEYKLHLGCKICHEALNKVLIIPFKVLLFLGQQKRLNLSDSVSVIHINHYHHFVGLTIIQTTSLKIHLQTLQVTTCVH